MRLGACCCNEPVCASCPAYPADMSTRDYRIVVPEFPFYQFGRPSTTPVGTFTGANNPGSDGWTMGRCQLLQDKTFFYEGRLTNCQLGYGDSWTAYANNRDFVRQPGYTTANIVPTLLTPGNGGFFSDVTSNVGSVYFQNRTVNFSRCLGSLSGCTCTNVSSLSISCTTGIQAYNYNNNCYSETQSMGSCTVEVFYAATTYVNTANPIALTYRLIGYDNRPLQYNQVNNCPSPGDADMVGTHGYGGACDLAPSSVPGNFIQPPGLPQTISIVRFA